jgi:hypothetical protein
MHFHPVALRAFSEIAQKLPSGDPDLGRPKPVKPSGCRHLGFGRSPELVRQVDWPLTTDHATIVKE